jgi:hypothetical protein
MIVGAGIAARAAGVGAFDAYPTVAVESGWPALLVAAFIPLAAAVPLVRCPGG